MKLMFGLFCFKRFLLYIKDVYDHSEPNRSNVALKIENNSVVISLENLEFQNRVFSEGAIFIHVLFFYVRSKNIKWCYN